MHTIKLFRQNTLIQHQGSTMIIDCKQGLWSVRGKCHSRVIKQAQDKIIEHKDKYNEVN